MAVSYESHMPAQSHTWCTPPTKHTHTQSHTLLDPINEMSVKSIIVSFTAVEIYFMSECVFVCRHRRVWVYECESIRMWVSECTRSHILTAEDILLWQLAGNGHHRLTVYDNKLTCSRIPPLHLYLFNLCACVCVCVVGGSKPKKHMNTAHKVELMLFCVSTVYEIACIWSFYKHCGLCFVHARAGFSLLTKTKTKTNSLVVNVAIILFI